MGGRGTYAAGKSAMYSYETVGEIEGVKVLRGLDGKHGLPESSHASKAYIKLNMDGSFREMRFYDKNHVLTMEIAYHNEEQLTGNRHTAVLHYHIYDNRFSINSSGPYGRTAAQRLTDKMFQQYKKYFKGVTQYD